MSFGGHAQDMFNRFKYNRSIRPSQKPKFKENYRDNIYKQNASKKDKSSDLEQKISAKTAYVIIEKIRTQAQINRQKTVITYLLYLILVIILLVIWFQI
jgi:hypothetical protein